LLKQPRITLDKPGVTCHQEVLPVALGRRAGPVIATIEQQAA
jgi:hypothetical protein